MPAKDENGPHGRVNPGQGRMYLHPRRRHGVRE
jgi:hypothetical protein